MILLDTDILSFLFANHPKVSQRYREATDVIATTIISRIQVLRGRFDFLLKAEDGEELQRAQHWLEKSERDLDSLAIIPINSSSAAEFDHLRQNKKLKKIGRADLLIASITLAHDATLVTRNIKHFQQVPSLKIENWAD